MLNILITGSTEILWATVYMIMGMIAAWHLWYYKIYVALRYELVTLWLGVHLDLLASVVSKNHVALRCLGFFNMGGLNVSFIVLMHFENSNLYCFL